MKISSQAALEVVILTTSSAAGNENFIKMKTFPFQWMIKLHYRTEYDLMKDSSSFVLMGDGTIWTSILYKNDQLILRRDGATITKNHFLISTSSN